MDNEGIGVSGSELSGSRGEEAAVGGLLLGVLLLPGPLPVEAVVFGIEVASRLAPGSKDLAPEFA